MQTIQLHPFIQCYPFNLHKQTQFTFLQVIINTKSQSELLEYRHNLNLFKTLDEEIVIKLDSFANEGNKVMIYYEYEPISIKMYIEEKLNLINQQEKRDGFLNKTVHSINETIEKVIIQLMQKRILAVLSIENMTVAFNDRIKFFIYPDFQVFQEDKQNNLKNQLVGFYSAQKKKIQIQFEEFLEVIVTKKSQQKKKANFIIQGSKLVFVGDDETTRHSTMSSISNIIGNIKSLEKNNIKPQNNQLECKDKQKFDIKNILDDKKLQKNVSPFLSNRKQQSNHEKQQIDPKRSFGNQKDISKQVKNYFENNDDFNKDASFYPQQFIREDSISQIDGYQEELQRQLQDLKQKKLITEQDEIKQKRLSMAPQNIDFKSMQTHNFEDQKMYKPTSTYHQESQNLNGKPYSKIPNQANTSNGLKPHNPSSYLQQKLNNSASNTSQQNHQNSTDYGGKQRKKYKVKILTSHQVDVQEGDDIDLKQIQKQIIQDIRKGTLSTNNQYQSQHIQQSQSKNHSNTSSNVSRDSNQYNKSPTLLNNSKGNQQQSHHFESAQQIHGNFPNMNQYDSKNRSLNNLSSSNISSGRQQAGHHDDTPFSKMQHPHISAQVRQNNYTAPGKQIQTKNLILDQHSIGGHSKQINNLHNPDIKKIIEKIKSSSNAQSSLLQQTNQKEFHHQSGINTSNFQPRSPSEHEQEQRPHSQLSSHTIMNNKQKQISNMNSKYASNQSHDNKQTNQHDKDYYDKIQKAKLKAEQIMKLVKQRKVQ